MQQARCRRNRIGAHGDVEAGQSGAGDEAPCGGFGAGDGAVNTGFEVRRLDGIAAHAVRHLRRFTEGVAGLECSNVSLGHIR